MTATFLAVRRFFPGSLALALTLSLAVSCASAPSGPQGSSSANGGTPDQLSGKTDKSGNGEVTQAAAGTPGAGTPLTVPSRDELGKNAVDSAVVALLENATPSSLREAVSRVHADSRGMNDRNRVFLAVAGELMKILYPLETIDWQMPSIPEDDPWVQAIRSARMGVYDYNTGNADFLATVLPSLVLFISPTSRDFYPDANAALASASAKNPRSPLPALFRGLMAERGGDLSSAGEWYRSAWTLDSGCYPAGEGLVRVLLAANDGDTAWPVAKTMLDRYPDSLSMVKLCAESSIAAAEWDTADTYVLRVLKAEPSNSAYLLLRARILVERKDYLKANSLLDAYATVDRTNRDYLILKARVMTEWNKNLVSAIGIVEDADRRYPNDPDIMLVAADLSYQTGKPVNGIVAREYVRSILASDPANVGALSLLSNDFIRAESWAEALESTASLVSLDPSPSGLAIRLRALIGAGHFPEALPLSKQLYEAEPNSTDAVSWRLETLIGSGDASGALTLVETRLSDASPALKSRLFYYRASIESNADARLASLRSSLLADPRNADALFAMYDWYLARKDYRKAQYYLKQVIAIAPGNEGYAKLLANLDVLLAQ